MSRGLGVTDHLATALEPAEPVLALVTQLGDTWFLVALGVACFWTGARSRRPGWDRRRGLLVLGVGLWAIAATYFVKSTLAWPRPAGAETAVYAIEGPLGLLYASAATATGYGFPSGHAVAATAVYGTLVWLAPGARTAGRLAGTAGLVALIAFTRLGLGLHYLVDVLAGAALGLAIAAVTGRTVSRPGTILALAVVTAGARVVVGPAGPRTAALLGLVVGVLAAWWTLGREHRWSTGIRARAAGTLAIACVACLVCAALFAWQNALPPAAGLAALAGGLLAVGLPETLWPEK